jgi:hypothetical protein
VANPAAYPLALAVETVTSLGLLAQHQERTLAMRRVFEERTGGFGPEDAWFDVRSRAFWDDALTRQGFARDVLGELPEPALAWARALGRAHRGLFYASTTSGRRMVRDLWSGAEFFVDEVDDAMRTALDAPSGPFDGRVAALSDPVRVGLLPGAVFHPEDAIEAIEQILETARQRSMEKNDVLDALLRMELALRSLSRVKPGYAYRVQALVDAR